MRTAKKSFSDEPEMHLKSGPKATKCSRCKAPLKGARWTADPMYWDYAIYNCQKRKATPK